MIETHPADTPRRYSTLREWAYTQLREMIVTGELAPGAVILEGDLCERLDISKSPLREALRQLHQEGLIDTVSNKGSRVATLSEQDIEEIYQLRAYIESMAVRLACAKRTAPDIADLRNAIHALEAIKSSGDLRAIAEQDIRFHLLLAQISGNRRLIRIQQNLQIEMLRLVMRQFLDWGDAAESDAVRRHTAIVDAIEANDPDAAEREMRAHIAKGQEFRRSAKARFDATSGERPGDLRREGESREA